MNPSVNTGGRIGKFGQLLSGEVRKRGITPHFIDIFVVRTPGARRASMLLDILVMSGGILSYYSQYAYNMCKEHCLSAEQMRVRAQINRGSQQLCNVVINGELILTVIPVV